MGIKWKYDKFHPAFRLKFWLHLGRFWSSILPKMGNFGQIWVDLSNMFYPIMAYFGKLGGFESSVSPNLGRFWQIGLFWGPPVYPEWAGFGKFGFSILPNLGRFGDFSQFGNFGSSSLPRMGRFWQIGWFLGLPFDLIWADLDKFWFSILPNLGRFG